MSTKKWSFTEDQRRDLRNFGSLNAEQIERLQVEGLPRIHNYVVELPPLKDVRGELDTLLEKLKSAHGALGLISRPGDDLVAQEILHRIAASDFNHGKPFTHLNPDLSRPGERIQAAFEALAAAVEVIDAARLSVPGGQRRRSTHWGVVNVINELLRELNPVRGDSSPFQSVLRTCLSAVGSNANADHLIRIWQSQPDNFESNGDQPI